MPVRVCKGESCAEWSMIRFEIVRADLNTYHI